MELRFEKLLPTFKTTDEPDDTTTRSATEDGATSCNVLMAHTPEFTSKTTYLSPKDPSSIPDSPNPAEDEVKEREELRRRLSERLNSLQQEMNSLRSTFNSLSPACKISNKDWPSTRNLQPDEPRSRSQEEASPEPDEPRSRTGGSPTR